MNKYKVGDKVVYEVKEIIRDGVYLLSGWKESEPLSTYTEPLERKNKNKQEQIEKLVDKLHRQAAEITRLLEENKELKEESKRNYTINIEMARAEGHSEAWELARKIFDMETNDIEDIFITEDAWNLGTVLNNYTYQEAAAKVEAWEKTKEEIKVGDIITHEEYDKDLCVMHISPNKKHYNAIDGYGTYYLLTKKMITKTGRHIDIDSFLKQIGEE